MLVGVFNRISPTEGGVIWSCVSGVVDALPKRYTNSICVGREDLSSCKMVLRGVINKNHD